LFNRGCQTTRRLSNRLFDQLNVCVHDATCCSNGLSSNWLKNRLNNWAASCKQTFNQLLNRLFNRFDNRLYRVNWETGFNSVSVLSDAEQLYENLHVKSVQWVSDHEGHSISQADFIYLAALRLDKMTMTYK